MKAPRKTGYTFAGWYSDEDFTNEVTMIPKGSTGDKTFYAKWTANKYTIVFKGNENTGGSMTSIKNCEYGSSYTLKENAFKKTGYTFDGWNTKADGSGSAYTNKEKVTNLSSENGSTVTLYAQWKLTEYSITYKLSGGENNINNPETYNMTTETITLKKPGRDGYTFKGWYKDKNYTKRVKQIPKGSTGELELYAKWSVDIYDITYKLNGGKNNSKNPSSYKITTSTIKLQKPTRKGYIFEGWYSDPSYTEQVTRIKKGSTGDKILYAKWSEK